MKKRLILLGVSAALMILFIPVLLSENHSVTNIKETSTETINASTSEKRNSDWAVLIDKKYNLFRVTNNFYRSAQFDKEIIPLLKQSGIKTVISLRAFHSDKNILKNSGIERVRIPIYTWDIDDDEIVEALQALRRAEKNGAVLLHCQHGADRTGLVTAMYRMLYQGWSKEKALDELKNGNYGYHTIWQNIPTYINKVDLEKIRHQVESGV